MIKALIDREKVEFNDRDFYDEEGRYIELENGEGYILFKDSESAGDVARMYWKDMVQDDPEEFKSMVGAEILLAWCLGQRAGPGSTAVSSLEEWFDLVASIPEEHFATYDNTEREFKCDHPDFVEYTVAYRTN